MGFTFLIALLASSSGDLTTGSLTLETMKKLLSLPEGTTLPLGSVADKLNCFHLEKVVTLV